MSEFDSSAQLAKLQALLKNKVGKTQSSFNRTERALWRPKLDQPEVIRIAPSTDGELPFQELDFYYNTGVKKEGSRYDISILSPSSYAKDGENPINDHISSIREGGSDYSGIEQSILDAVIQKLTPTTKWYLPIIVIGQESQGVKYWGVTQKFFDLLASNLVKDGNIIYDPVKGHNLKVWLEDMGNYKGTKFELGRLSSLADTEELRNEILNNRPNLIDQFTKMDNKEIADVIKQIWTPFMAVDSTPPEDIPATDYTALRQAAPENPEPTVVLAQEPVAKEEDHFNDLPF